MPAAIKQDDILLQQILELLNKDPDKCHKIRDIGADILQDENFSTRDSRYKKIEQRLQILYKLKKARTFLGPKTKQRYWSAH